MKSEQLHQVREKKIETMKQNIKEAALDYMQSHECNFFAEDKNVTLTVGMLTLQVESIWRNKKEGKVYLHVGCTEFEGDLDIESLSDENQERMLEAFGVGTKRDEPLERIAQDEDLQEDFFIRFSEELASDDEPARKKFVQLYEAYKKAPELVDDILMTLCGWTMKSLAEKTFE